MRATESTLPEVGAGMHHDREKNYAYPELYRDDYEEYLERLPAWTGKTPPHPYEGYQHEVTEEGHTAILLAAWAGSLGGSGEPFWLYQGHNGCSYHATLGGLTVCNAAGGDGHPNLSAELRDGRTLEVVWDELATKPWRTSSNLRIDRETALLLVQAAYTSLAAVSEVPDVLGYTLGELMDDEEYGGVIPDREAARALLLEALGLTA